MSTGVISEGSIIFSWIGVMVMVSKEQYLGRGGREGGREGKVSLWCVGLYPHHHPLLPSLPPYLTPPPRFFVSASSHTNRL